MLLDHMAKTVLDNPKLQQLTTSHCLKQPIQCRTD